MPPLNGGEHRSNRNNSFTATHITLQESMHWVRPCKIRNDVIDYSSLRASKSKGQSSNESIHKFVINSVFNSARVTLKRALSGNEHELHAK